MKNTILIPRDVQKNLSVLHAYSKFHSSESVCTQADDQNYDEYDTEQDHDERDADENYDDSIELNDGLKPQPMDI